MQFLGEWPSWMAGGNKTGEEKEIQRKWTIQLQMEIFLGKSLPPECNRQASSKKKTKKNKVTLSEAFWNADTQEEESSKYGWLQGMTMNYKEAWLNVWEHAARQGAKLVCWIRSQVLGIHLIRAWVCLGLGAWNVCWFAKKRARGKVGNGLWIDPFPRSSGSCPGEQCHCTVYSPQGIPNHTELWSGVLGWSSRDQGVVSLAGLCSCPIYPSLLLARSQLHKVGRLPRRRKDFLIPSKTTSLFLRGRSRGCRSVVWSKVGAQKLLELRIKFERWAIAVWSQESGSKSPLDH